MIRRADRDKDGKISELEVLQIAAYIGILLKYANEGDINDCSEAESSVLDVCKETWDGIYQRVVKDD